MAVGIRAKIYLKQERVPLGCATDVVHGRADSWKTANRGLIGLLY